MKLKYNHDGVTLIIALTDTKPAGKSFAVRHNGTVYYAPLVPVDDPLATDCTIVFDGQPYALDRGIAPNSVTLNGASSYEVTAEDRQRGVIVTDFSNDVNITGLTFSDIKTCSYSSGTITLGLVGKVKIVLPNATSNRLNFNGTTVYVGDDFFANADIASATSYSIAAYGSAVINRSTATSALTFDASLNKKGVTLIGGTKNDTFYGGTGNNVLTGGAGANIFMHEGGRDVITDYIAGGGKVYLANGHVIGDVSGVSVDTSGVTLTFGDNDSIEMQGVGSSDAVTFSHADDTFGIGYTFANDTVRTASGRGVTLTKAENHTVANGEVTVIANAGGSIAAGSTAALIGGYNVSVKGGEGNDVFVYKGGTMNIADFGANDKISLMSGYTVTDSSFNKDNSNFKLTVSNGTETQTITLGDVAESVNMVNVNINGTDKGFAIPRMASILSASGDQVTLITADKADFGVIGSASGLDEAGNVVVIGNEYAAYSAIFSVVATKENSQIVGNSKANTFVIAGGDSNIITGGMKNDTFIFESGGGIITDFGVATTKNGANKYLATSTTRTETSTYVAFDRDNPTSYAQAADVLKVNGTVVEIAFRQDSGDYDSATESTFTAYVTYRDDNKYSTIALANIAKRVKEYDKEGGGAGAVYEDNATVVTTRFNIWDTGKGYSVKLSDSALAELSVDKSNSAYSSAIARLDAIIQARGITTYSADGKVASVSNGIVAAHSAT